MTLTRIHVRASGQVSRPADEAIYKALYGVATLDPRIKWKDDHEAVLTIHSWSKPAIVFLERILHHIGPYRLNKGKLEITKLEIIPRREIARKAAEQVEKVAVR